MVHALDRAATEIGRNTCLLRLNAYRCLSAILCGWVGGVMSKNWALASLPQAKYSKASFVLGFNLLMEQLPFQSRSLFLFFSIFICTP
jgi:hypothetical protein